MNYGEDVWTHWNHEYGEGIPYLLPSKRVFGKRLHPLYLEWKESFFDRYNKQIADIEEEGTSVFEIIKLFESVSGLKLNYEIGSRREGDVPISYANPAKAERELGWKANLSLKEGLSSAWDWEKRINNL